MADSPSSASPSSISSEDGAHLAAFIHSLQHPSLIERIIAFITKRRLSWRLQKWFDYKFKIGVYELQGEEIVAWRGRREPNRVFWRDIVAWRIHMEMGFDIIAIELCDHGVVTWIDTYDDLIAILRQVAPDHEKPWVFA